MPLELAIVKVKGDGKRVLAVFTDPDCPYCKRLEGELAQIDNVTIYIFLFPLASLHTDAPRKSHLIWCAPDKVKAWDAMMQYGQEPVSADQNCTDPIADIATAARKLWLQGTPGLIFGNGRLVPGAIPHDKIEEHLSAPVRS